MAYYIDPDKCNCCGRCEVEECDAVCFIDGTYQINQSECDDCWDCVLYCPINAIIYVPDEVSLLGNESLNLGIRLAEHQAIPSAIYEITKAAMLGNTMAIELVKSYEKDDAYRTTLYVGWSNVGLWKYWDYYIMAKVCSKYWSEYYKKALEKNCATESEKAFLLDWGNDFDLLVIIDSKLMANDDNMSATLSKIKEVIKTTLLTDNELGESVIKKHDDLMNNIPKWNPNMLEDLKIPPSSIKEKIGMIYSLAVVTFLVFCYLSSKF